MNGNKQNVSAKTLRNRRRRQRRRARLAEKIVNAETQLSSEIAGGFVGFGPNATRSGITPNPADPRTTHTLMQLGNTIGGRQAALKILHPCMEECNAVVKIPDGAVSTSVVMERRDEYQISTYSTNNSERNWNCVVITAPFLQARQVAIRYDASAPLTEEDVQLVVQLALESTGVTHYPSWDVHTFVKPDPVGSINVEYTSLVSTTLSPNLYDETTKSISGLLKSIRRTCLGVTTDLDASELYNEGRVVSGQWTPNVSLGTIHQSSGTPATVTSLEDVYRIQVPAVTTATVVSSDEFCREAEAKFGSYMPIRPCEPDWPLTSSQEWRGIVVDVPGQEEVVGTAGTPDLYLRGWSIGVSVWTGLNAKANLRIKVREDMELVASPDSVYSPFATPALPDDMRARQMIQEFSRKQPHDYPADFNEYGKMIPKIVSGIGDALADLGLPVISDIARGVSSIAKGPIGGWLGGLLDKLF